MSTIAPDTTEFLADIVRDAGLFVDRGPCALCRGTRTRPVHDFADIPVRRCAACGFIHSARIMTPQGLRRYYSDTFGSPRHLLGQRVNAEVNARAIERLVNLRSIGSFLDVGTGYGFLLKTLRDRHGIDVKGAELSKQEAAHAQQVLGLDVRMAALGDAGFVRSSFDVVACFEVIEHVPDPIPFVTELAEYVRPGGWLLVSTDNFEAAAVRRLGAEFPKWIPHSHVSHFAPTTLEKCIASVPGLTAERRLSYTPWELGARALSASFRPARRPAAECFDLAAAIRREHHGKFPFFKARLRLNRIWFYLSCRNDLERAMMYLLARKSP